MSAVKDCANCGVTFRKDPRNTWGYWAKARFCSQACAGEANSRRLSSKRPPIERVFARNVVQSGECWEWTGSRDKDGYGVFTYARKQYRAPKTALELDGRPVPRGMHACHTCDNPACVRPAHLYVGTPAQNSADAKQRGRVRVGRKAKVTPDQVRAIRAAVGTHNEIAARFGLSPANISLIRNRRTWADVQ